MLVGKMKIWGKVQKINRICRASSTTVVDEARGKLGKWFSLKPKRQLKVARNFHSVAKFEIGRKALGNLIK